MRSPLRFLSNVAAEVARAGKMSNGLGPMAKIGCDAFAYRVSRSKWWDGQTRRRVSLSGGVEVQYRLNRGDYWSFREVWLYGAYRLPFVLPKYDILVDLGANIALTSVWLAREYGFKRLIAVEPVPSNAEVAELNLKTNLPDLEVELIRAAVGPTDGFADFTIDVVHSNMGHVERADDSGSPAAGGLRVPMVSMQTVLNKLPAGAEIDVLKLDIEGGEQALLTGDDLSWLSRVRSIVAEFHPAIIDYPGLIRRVEEQGFVYFKANSVFPDNMDAFVRKDLANEALRAFKAESGG